MRILLLAALLVGMSVWTTDGASQEGLRPDVRSVEGALSQFHAEQRRLWIQIRNGPEMEFRYDVDTPIVGATRYLRFGDPLRIFYQVQDNVNRAMTVEVIQQAAHE